MEEREIERLKILNEASLLGEMMQRTDVYLDFAQSEREIGENTGSREALRRYQEYAEDIQTRQRNGFPVEPNEFDLLRQIAAEVGADPVAMSYVRTKESYIELLETIKAAVHGE